MSLVKLHDTKLILRNWFLCIYTNNKPSEREILKKNHYHCIKKNKIPRSNLTKEILRKIWHWWKKLEMTQTDGKVYQAHELEELILLKLTIPLKPIYNQIGIHCNPYQNTDDIFYRTRTNSIKMYMESQVTPNRQSNLEKKEQ